MHRKIEYRKNKSKHNWFFRAKLKYFTGSRISFGKLRKSNLKYW